MKRQTESKKNQNDLRPRNSFSNPIELLTYTKLPVRGMQSSLTRQSDVPVVIEGASQRGKSGVNCSNGVSDLHLPVTPFKHRF